MIDEYFQKIIDGLNGLRTELHSIEARIGELEYKNDKNECFFDNLEILLKNRNNH